MTYSKARSIASELPENGADPRLDGDVATWTEGIGQKLRQRRKVRRKSLKEVATRSSLSIGLLSQIERGISSPSLRSLKQICEALEMPMSWLFDKEAYRELEPEPWVVRQAQRRRMNLGSGSMIKDILSPDSISEIQLMRFVIHPGGRSGDSPAQHPTGAKCGTVLSGSLGLEINGQEHILNQDDSFAFKANAQYRFWAVGDTDCEVIWAVTPALY
ncbi:helix-turn-helix domain-containing protein [Bordetella sp. BOR01]|uniref:helix-turn-helix domain-containing protein n=1 Tax=Bordetella sp. BOR01 TaxID=2854779 RepID=UPI001C47E6A4|nr:cupin domain-containing protein [Bordetella sp. BOR01]MBV7485260.1 cupin domain-containing protein [Bordetella sp. BOR01]